jgi:glyoxylase-like metal-dependent hydrolase (beta-lactamase superfamily II)
MKPIVLAAAVASLVAWAPVTAQSPLVLHVITASPQGFLVNSTLVTGAHDAVLIDAAFTVPDARKIVDSVRASGKTLTTVYVTHGHPDHYFGLEVIREAFPNARFVALPATVAAIQQTWKAKVDQWKPLYKEAITSTPVLPGALEGNAITLEGQTLEIVGPVQGDDAENSYVWIPSLRAVVTGDIVYSGVFVWTAETDPAARTRWAATLDRLAALNPAVVVRPSDPWEGPRRRASPSPRVSRRSSRVAVDHTRAAGGAVKASTRTWRSTSSEHRVTGSAGAR